VIWGFDGGKWIKGRKRHIGTDTLGLLHGLAVTEANLGDREGAKLVVEQVLGRRNPRLVRLLVDQGYAGPDLAAWVLAVSGWTLEVVCKRPGQRGFEVQPKRWIVERTFGWLNYSRRLSKEYEELPSSSEAMIRIAMIQLMLKRLDP
jgi:transposase